LLTHPTVDQLVKLGLAGMARAFTELQSNQSAADLSHAEWLALLLDREATERSNRQLTARLRHAKLRQRATIEDIDWRAPRDLDRTLFQRLIAGDWIDAPHNLIIEGPTGVGKSWLACALGNKACRDNRSVLYQRVPKLFGDLALVKRFAVTERHRVVLCGEAYNLFNSVNFAANVRASSAAYRKPIRIFSERSVA